MTLAQAYSAAVGDMMTGRDRRAHNLWRRVLARYRWMYGCEMFMVAL